MDKQILEYLAPYLPYAIKMQRQEDKTIDFLCQVCNNNGFGIQSIKVGLRNYRLTFSLVPFPKPILRPLSDLTKEIEYKGERFVPSEYIYNNYWIKIREDGHFSFHHGDGTCTGYKYQSAPYNLIQKLLSWHFDVFGLIPKGLAVDINTIESEVEHG